jgi:hypothetical protein
MTSNVINLRTARRRRARDRAACGAAENRVKFGRTKLQKTKDHSETQKTDLHLDGHRVDGTDDD